MSLNSERRFLFSACLPACLTSALSRGTGRQGSGLPTDRDRGGAGGADTGGDLGREGNRHYSETGNGRRRRAVALSHCRRTRERTNERTAAADGEK